jgi:RIO kinase 3
MEGQIKVVSQQKACPWGVLALAKPEPCSLSTVMDEELAKELDREERREEVSVEHVPQSSVEEETVSSDYLLAQMLQHEFDREHDQYIAAKEKHVNGNSKVSVSFDNYRWSHPALVEDMDNPYDNMDDEDDIPGDHQVLSPGSGGKTKKKRVKPVGGQPTKHDPVVCGRKNVENIETQFPVTFPAGDVADERSYYRLSNPVYNSLKLHAKTEQHRAERLHEKKEHSTHEQALDEKTRLMLFKLVDSGMLEEINGCVSTGKEACVYHAPGGTAEDRVVPPEVAIKVFKTTLNEFKNRDKYIKDDYRFKQRFRKQNPRKVIHMWAEKEMHNLKRLHEGGVPCPSVVLLKKHVLLMEFIGKNGRPAPKLSDLSFTDDLLKKAYDQCVEGMKNMFRKCHLVHADLSAFNMLWHNGKVHFIDVSQSVEPTHPHGFEFLLRDCTNVSTFFTKKGLPDVPSPQELFNDITQLNITADSKQEFLTLAKAHQKEPTVLEHMKENPDKVQGFDYHFDRYSHQICDMPSSSSEEEHSS